jgi:hypothetical protein
MAVVFISPKQRQKMFFLGITVVLVLFLAGFSLVILFSKPKEISSALVFNKPKVSIDMKVFDSGQFKNLKSFTQVKIQYSYKIKNTDGTTQTQFISATSESQAFKSLKDLGLNFTDLQEVKVGRDNPFVPYY